MDTMTDLKQIFVNNLGNKLSPELATGMIDAIIRLIPVINEVSLPAKEE